MPGSQGTKKLMSGQRRERLPLRGLRRASNGPAEERVFDQDQGPAFHECLPPPITPPTPLLPHHIFRLERARPTGWCAPPTGFGPLLLHWGKARLGPATRVIGQARGPAPPWGSLPPTTPSTPHLLHHTCWMGRERPARRCAPAWVSVWARTIGRGSGAGLGSARLPRPLPLPTTNIHHHLSPHTNRSGHGRFASGYNTRCKPGHPERCQSGWAPFGVQGPPPLTSRRPLGSYVAPDQRPPPSPSPTPFSPLPPLPGVSP